MSYFTQQTDPMINFDRVDMKALEMLESARGRAGIHFIVTSTYRSPEHSVEVGGSPTDAHTDDPCTAFDIMCSGDGDRAKIIGGCWEAGFRRFGINKKNGHVHVDHSNRPSPAMWVEG